MTLKEVQEIIKHLVEYDIEDFEYEKSGVRVRVRRRRAEPQPTQELRPAAIVTGIPMATALGQSPAVLIPETKPAEKAPEPKSEDLFIVRSPIVGTFYQAPNPTAPPFVKVGSKVSQGQVLCIVEAMKLMNEIEAEVGGEIIEVYVENKEPVEYGQPLFAIRSTSAKNR